MFGREAVGIVGTREELAQYVACLFLPDDVIEWRAIGPGPVQRGWVLARQLVDLTPQFQALNERHYSIYAGTNPRRGFNQTGDASVDLCRCLFVDFDHLTDDPGASYDDILSGILSRNGVPVPTLKTFTGHGCHCFWRLREPILPDVWSNAQQALIELLGSDKSIKNPERIMRVVGFDNVKDPANPVPCFIIEADPSKVFDLADLLSHCRQVEPPPQQSAQPVGPAAGQKHAVSEAMNTKGRAMTWASRWEGVSAPGRHNTCFRHGAELVNDFGLPDGEALEILLAWDTLNMPPLGEAEVRRTLGDAKKYAKRQPGSKAQSRRPPARATGQQTGPGRPTEPVEPPPASREPGDDPVDQAEPPRRPPEDLGPCNTDQGGRLALQEVEESISGELIDWPWPQLTELTELPAPGDVLALCGPPGSTKTFFMVQALRAWLAAGRRATMLIMEEDIQHILSRGLAQLSGQPGMTSRRWKKANPERAREIVADHKATMDTLGRRLFDLPRSDITLHNMTRWIASRIAEGDQLIIVDPITAAVQMDKPWIAESGFLNGCKRMARDTNTSIILTTHPKLGASTKISLDSLAGSASSIRFCQGILWLEALEEEKTLTVQGPHDPHTEQRIVNRVVHILKARNARGKGLRIGYRFDERRLEFDEVGVVRKAPRQRKDDGEAW